MVNSKAIIIQKKKKKAKKRKRNKGKLPRSVKVS